MRVRGLLAGLQGPTCLDLRILPLRARRSKLAPRLRPEKLPIGEAAGCHHTMQIRQQAGFCLPFLGACTATLEMGCAISLFLAKLLGC